MESIVVICFQKKLYFIYIDYFEYIKYKFVYIIFTKSMCCLVGIEGAEAESRIC